MVNGMQMTSPSFRPTVRRGKANHRLSRAEAAWIRTGPMQMLSDSYQLIRLLSV
jgi:hypothetical protein